MRWQPSVTVAAIIEREGKFLFVEEHDATGKRVINQPAGHWENGETLWAAARRETLEESGWDFTPTGLLNIYHWRHSPDTTYLRFAFVGQLGAHDPLRRLDEGIVGTLWLSLDELAAQRDRHRSPLVMRCVEDYINGKPLPLEVIKHII